MQLTLSTGLTIALHDVSVDQVGMATWQDGDHDMLHGAVIDVAAVGRAAHSVQGAPDGIWGWGAACKHTRNRRQAAQ